MELKKELTLLDVFCISSGAMMSAGFFILPGIVYAQVGPGAFVAYFLAGLLALMGVLSQAELASAMPKAGGTYFFVIRSMGPAVGTVYGLITLLAMALKSAFALVGMAVFTVLIINLNQHIIATFLCAVFVVINIVGIKEAGRLQVVLVLCIFAALLFYVIRGLPALDVQRFERFAPGGLGAIFAMAGFVFVSYGGLLKVASVAEEVKAPGRLLPLGMILSLFAIVICYVMVIFVTVGVVGGSTLKGSLTPISDGAAAFMGQGGRIALSIVAILGFCSAANAGIMAASRYPLALSRDGLLPEVVGRIHPRFHTPHVSVLVTGAIIFFAIFLEMKVLVKAASSVLILSYMFACVANIILRESHLQNYQPQFLAPLYPWVQIIGIVGCGLLLLGIGNEGILTSVILIVSGFLVYWFYGRIKAKKEYALLHIVERVTAKELTTHGLETELKEIIRERDEIVKDRFDGIIEQGIVLDIQESMPAEAFFRLASEKLGEKLKLDPEGLVKLFLDRERYMSSVLAPGLAIPHIVVEGGEVFDILLARCKEGIVFSESTPRVHAVFVLLGTRDERNFHLRALSAIAQIVQDPHFEKKWTAAKSKEVLRDIVLLGKRRRH